MGGFEISEPKSGFDNLLDISLQCAQLGLTNPPLSQDVVASKQMLASVGLSANALDPFGHRCRKNAFELSAESG